MTRDRLAEAWPHIRRAVEILLYGSEIQAESQPPAPIEYANANRRESLFAEIREIFSNDAEPAEPLPSNVCVSGDKIPGGVRWGTYSRIAHNLGVTPQHVRKVALGLSTSKRVSDELARYGVGAGQKVGIGDAA